MSLLLLLSHSVQFFFHSLTFQAYFNLYFNESSYLHCNCGTIFFPPVLILIFFAYDMKNVCVTLKYCNAADTEQRSTGPVIRLSMDPVQTNVFHFSQTVLLFLTVGDEKGGQMVLHGEPDVVAQLGPQ
jgi:hypothetical protein